MPAASGMRWPSLHGAVGALAEADAAAGLAGARAARGAAQGLERLGPGDAAGLQARGDLEALDGARGLVGVRAVDGDARGRRRGAACCSPRTWAPLAPGRSTRALTRGSVVCGAAAGAAGALAWTAGVWRDRRGTRKGDGDDEHGNGDVAQVRHG